ncbi:MAG: glutaredoxin family protein [Thermoanaerobaculia bacterium]|nr:glutaredoxin family protein [Thermoanaerobaculia bacterium]
MKWIVCLLSASLLSFVATDGFARAEEVPAGDPEAGILVMKDGSRVDVRDGFEVDGRKVTFHSPSGVFSVLRASEVDFEATELANRPPPPEPEPTSVEPEPRPEPVLILTDATIAKADPDVISPRVTLYVTDWCSVCRSAERFFHGAGVPFRAIDVETMPGAQAEKDRISPGCGVPVILIGSESMCGFSEGRARRLLAQLRPAESSAEDGSRSSLSEGQEAASRESG